MQTRTPSPTHSWHTDPDALIETWSDLCRNGEDTGTATLEANQWQAYSSFFFKSLPVPKATCAGDEKQRNKSHCIRSFFAYVCLFRYFSVTVPILFITKRGSPPETVLDIHILQYNSFSTIVSICLPVCFSSLSILTSILILDSQHTSPHHGLKTIRIEVRMESEEEHTGRQMEANTQSGSLKH